MIGTINTHSRNRDGPREKLIVQCTEKHQLRGGVDVRNMKNMSDNHKDKYLLSASMLDYVSWWPGLRLLILKPLCRRSFTRTQNNGGQKSYEHIREQYGETTRKRAVGTHKKLKMGAFTDWGNPLHWRSREKSRYQIEQKKVNHQQDEPWNEIYACI